MMFVFARGSAASSSSWAPRELARIIIPHDIERSSIQNQNFQIKIHISQKSNNQNVSTCLSCVKFEGFFWNSIDLLVFVEVFFSIS